MNKLNRGSARVEHNVIRTPVDTVNVVGAGGIQQGTITEIFGHPGAGKSAFSYQTAGFFLQDNPRGRVFIIDPETSADIIRLREVFKMDMDRLDIVNATILEDAFSFIHNVLIKMSDQRAEKRGSAEELRKKTLKQLYKMALKESEKDRAIVGSPAEPEELMEKYEDEDVAKEKYINLLVHSGVARYDTEEIAPALIVWDTIAASQPRTEVEAIVEGKDPTNAGGLGLKARVITNWLNTILADMYQNPLTLFILNQVRYTDFGAYGGPKITSSGGHALKHALHYRFFLHKPKNKEDEDNTGASVGTTTKFQIYKSKFGPTIKETSQGVPIVISDKLGGKILREGEAVEMAISIGKCIQRNGGWYNVVDEDGNKIREKSYRRKELYGDPDIRALCLDAIARHFRQNYLTLDTIYRELGYTLGDFDLDDYKDLLARERRIDEQTSSFDKEMFGYEKDD